MAVEIREVVGRSFEGPAGYSFVGGLALGMNDLAEALITRGRRVRHLFVGDPALAAFEERAAGMLKLERWGQWISRHHPKDVYDGEDGKWREFSPAAPPPPPSEGVLPAARHGHGAT